MMTQFEALKIAYVELANISDDNENSEILEAMEVIDKMIFTKAKQLRKRQPKNTLKTR